MVNIRNKFFKNAGNGCLEGVIWNCLSVPVRLWRILSGVHVGELRSMRGEDHSSGHPVCAIIQVDKHSVCRPVGIPGLNTMWIANPIQGTAVSSTIEGRMSQWLISMQRKYVDHLGVLNKHPPRTQQNCAMVEWTDIPLSNNALFLLINNLRCSEHRSFFLAESN